MSSIIPGFEYDIFISYRQKDNEYDGWVTEFVNNLKRELHATFKEDISIYFDANPRDGLLETHIVNESLARKLNCLIFIPVISQTYCDSKSYAWQYEFCTFNKSAKEDKFGRDVRLPSGNVVSRILPVKIHDLDPEDNSLLENELGGVLRCIEFIYRSAGVNRPLRNNEDHPQDNLNNTYYRDQINKVANAVKEIINSLKNSGKGENLIPYEKIQEHRESQFPEAIFRMKKRKTGIAVMLLLILIVGSIFIFRLASRKNRINDKIEKTIAVLPFQNLSNDTAQLWFCDGFTEDIRYNLQKVKSFAVRSKPSSDQYRDTKKSTTIIGNEINANYLVGGSVGQEGDRIKIWVNLIDSKADKLLWSNEYTRSKTQIFSLQSEIAREIVAELNTALTPEEKERIAKAPTNNPDAYYSYLQGRFFWNKRSEEGLKKSIDYFKESLTKAPDYALAYAGLADAYYILAWWGWLPRREGYRLAKENVLKALEIDKNLADAHASLGCYLHQFLIRIKLLKVCPDRCVVSIALTIPCID